MSDRKLQIALYWGAACGGCDVAVLDTDEFVLDLAAAADIRFWPIAVDGKYDDVEAMADGELDVTLFHGAIRNGENEHVARLLRRKSRVLVAFGSCAWLGGIPGLANACTKDEILSAAYLQNPSIESGNRTVPLPSTRINGFELEIPSFYARVYRLGDVVPVDYAVPGCPPAPQQVRTVLETIVAGNLPPRGAVLGAGERSVCEDCPRTRNEKKIGAFHRPWQIIADPALCLLDQGILCAGMATRSGCGSRCPAAGMPCRGCYGPAPGVADQGAKFLSAVASIVDATDEAGIAQVLGAIPDIMGYAYRFGLPASLLERRH